MSQPREVIDLEEFAKAGKPVPKDQDYKIRVDKTQYTVSQESLTGREILTLAGLTPPEAYILRQKIKGEIKRIALDEPVDFTQPGIERFMTIPNEVTEGETKSMRYQFELLAEDKAYLESLGLPWETVLENNVRRVVIHGYPIPKGYNVDKASVFVYLQPTYPDVQIDMAYFLPSLARKDDKAIGATSLTVFDGKNWQQWSRHRTANSKWRIGEDNLSTHMTLVNNWLEQEVAK